jgi:hypothetical protein
VIPRGARLRAPGLVRGLSPLEGWQGSVAVPFCPPRAVNEGVGAFRRPGRAWFPWWSSREDRA